MKQVFLFMAFFGLVAFTSNAQNCSSKKAAKSASVEKATCSSSKAAAKLAAIDNNIEERVCSKSGKSKLR